MAALSRTSLRAFLGPARSYLRDAIGNQKRIAFVVGNESCDLDSITSAIVYSYLCSSPPNHSDDSYTKSPSCYIPVLNIPKADVQIRPELLLLLKDVDVDTSHLITLDDIPLPSSKTSTSLKPEKSSWTLVDHNALTGGLGTHYSSRIVACIDHHIDEEQVPKDAEPRLIRKCGSCTSLVVEYCRPAWDRLSDAASVISSNPAQGQHDDAAIYEDARSRRKWDAQVAKVALASILVDTHNLTSEDKTTETDQKAVKYLEAKIHLAPAKPGEEFDRKQFFERLTQAKRDFSHMSVDEVLRKDYKMWETEKGSLTLGISSVIKPISFLVQKSNDDENSRSSEAFIREARKFAQERCLTVYGVMTSFADKQEQFSRELLLYVNDKQAFPEEKRFIETVVDQIGQELELEKQNFGGGQEELKVWNQKNTKDSRKQVAPMLRELLESFV